jgi:hypothetical protein
MAPDAMSSKYDKPTYKWRVGKPVKVRESAPPPLKPNPTVRPTRTIRDFEGSLNWTTTMSATLTTTATWTTPGTLKLRQESGTPDLQAPNFASKEEEVRPSYSVRILCRV